MSDDVERSRDGDGSDLDQTENVSSRDPERELESQASEEMGVYNAIPSNESSTDPSTGDSEEPVIRHQDFDRGSRRQQEKPTDDLDPPPRRDRDLPLDDYLSLTIPQIIEKIPTLPEEKVRAIRDYEKSHRRRKTLLVKLERRLRPSEGPPQATDRSRHT